MSEKISSNSTGPGIATLFTVLFVGLKLTGHITWSWWWVLSPIWISILLIVIIFIVVFVVAAMVEMWRNK